jgi:superfamily II DNA or RNA helicase
MKETELKLSEKKQIVVSSYVMCSEGLDIPTLNAEFLITPKTDIVQTVGRILRAKHQFSHPIIYDFVDSHDVFQRQWLKRKAYYKKQNYKIIGANSIEYNTDFSKWKIVFEPKAGQLCIAKTGKKETVIKSDSSEESDGDSEKEEVSKDKYLGGQCLLKFKK